MNSEHRAELERMQEWQARLQNGQQGDALFGHQDLYSPSSMNVMNMLIQIRMRPNPTIPLGRVDTSVALVICDNELPDSPIIYVTESFENLTGYRSDEILGRNCRFLQKPPLPANGIPSMEAAEYNKPLLQELRRQIQHEEEGQFKILNYKKNGEPFMNVLTVIPITFEDRETEGKPKKYLVGFQADERDLRPDLRSVVL